MNFFRFRYVNVDDIAADLQRLDDTNRRILAEVQATTAYETYVQERDGSVRSDGSGRAKLALAMRVIEQNKAEMERLQAELNYYNSSLMNVGADFLSRISINPFLENI